MWNGYGYRGALLVPLFFLLSVAPSRGASLEVEVGATPPKTARPGEIVTHVFTVANTGTEDELFVLHLEVPSGWSFFPKQESIFVEAGKVGYIFVNLIVPRDASAGTYEISLTASSSTDPTITDTAVTAVEVLPFRDIGLRWLDPPTALQVGGEARWKLEITNRGNVPDTYSLELEVFGDWEVRAEAAEVQLMPGEKARVAFFATVSPRAEPGGSYSLRVTATSIHDPTVSREISLSGRFLPPPPELVPRSLYPSWDIALSLKLASAGDPEFTFSGTGDIEFFDLQVDAETYLSMDGPSEPRVSLVGKKWSFYLHGGSISGAFLGVSGKPLFGGKIKGLGTWRALFTEEAKGISYTLRGEEILLRFAAAWGAASGLSFTDLVVNWDASETLSLWGTISRASDPDGTGYAWRCGIKVSGEDWELSGACLDVSPGYPRKNPGTEVSITWRNSTGPIPLTISYRFSSISRESPPSWIISHEARSEFSFQGAPLRPRLSLSYARRFDTLSPRTIDEWKVNSRLLLRGKGRPSWSFSIAPAFSEDLVLGRTTVSSNLSGGFGFELAGLRLSAEVRVSMAVVDGAPEHSSSLKLQARFPDLLGEPSLSLAVSAERTSLSFALRDIPAGEGEGDFHFAYALEGGESRWESSFSLSFPADFPFFGPTRGRIEGRVFIDRDGDRTFSPGDKGIQGLLLEADGFQAISGKGGRFVFPPLPPGTYSLSFVEPSPHFLLVKPLPTVDVERGKTVTVEIPLIPRAWLKVVVFRDDDRDGMQDPGEPGVPGVKIAISGPVEREVETDPSGGVSLELPPGNYSVRLLESSLPERFVPTTPTRVEVEVPEFGTAEVRFGAYRRPRPVVVTFAPPQAAISYTPEKPRVGEPVEFDGTGSRAFGAEIVEYRWEFRLGDKRIRAEEPRVEVTFPAPGKWTVILLVRDSRGRLGAATALIEVLP